MDFWGVIYPGPGACRPGLLRVWLSNSLGSVSAECEERLRAMLSTPHRLPANTHTVHTQRRRAQGGKVQNRDPLGYIAIMISY